MSIEKQEISPFQVNLAKHVAEDVHWMMQRLDLSAVYDTTELRIADTRYVRYLRKMAELTLDRLEKGLTDGDGD